MPHQKKTILFIKNVLGIRVILLKLITRKVAIYSKLELDSGTTNKGDDDSLFDELKKWRLEKSKEEKLPEVDLSR